MFIYKLLRWAIRIWTMMMCTIIIVHILISLPLRMSFQFDLKYKQNCFCCKFWNDLPANDLSGNVLP